jgi:hypothetical protein
VTLCIPPHILPVAGIIRQNAELKKAISEPSNAAGLLWRHEVDLLSVQLRVSLRPIARGKAVDGEDSPPAEHILPARPRKPRDRAKVEQAVLIVERWLLGPAEASDVHTSLAESCQRR